MAVLTLHHWSDVPAGLAQLRRVARQRIVIVTIDVLALARLWIIEDYFPEFIGIHTQRFPSIEHFNKLLPNVQVDSLLVPRDCSDQFLGALWDRPRSLLDPGLRAASAPWRDLPASAVDAGLDRLERELEDGTWQRRYGHLLSEPELDVGLRIVISRI